MNKPKAVIDTNVLVAAQRSRRGASSRLVSLIGTSAFEVHISVPLVLEYEEILLRQREELGLTQQDVSDLVDAICALGVQQKIYFLWRPYLRDADDAHVLELAVAARCGYIVTHNVRDFGGVERFDIQAVSPRMFLQILGEIE